MTEISTTNVMGTDDWQPYVRPICCTLRPLHPLVFTIRKDRERGGTSSSDRRAHRQLMSGLRDQSTFTCVLRGAFQVSRTILQTSATGVERCRNTVMRREAII